MTRQEYAIQHGIKSDEDWMNHFRNNMHSGKLPVAMYSCPKCDEILWDGTTDGHKCPREQACEINL